MQEHSVVLVRGGRVADSEAGARAAAGERARMDRSFTRRFGAVWPLHRRSLWRCLCFVRRLPPRRHRSPVCSRHALFTAWLGRCGGTAVMVEDEWGKAPVLEVVLDNLPYEPENGYVGMKETKVKLKSMYDNEYIYFLIQYADPTESLERFPWVKQQDGSWKQLSGA